MAHSFSSVFDKIPATSILFGPPALGRGCKLALFRFSFSGLFAGFQVNDLTFFLAPGLYLLVDPDEGYQRISACPPPPCLVFPFLSVLAP